MRHGIDVLIEYNAVNENILLSSLAPAKIAAMEAASRPYHHGHLREALLGAAEKALEAGGAQSFSLRELSRELGVSQASPRRHFADKQALLDALAVRGFERLDLALRSPGTKRGRDFQARLSAIARAYVEFALKHPVLLSLMHEAKARQSAPQALINASAQVFALVPATIVQAQAAGEVVPGDPVEMTLIFSAALLGLVSLSKEGEVSGRSTVALTDSLIERMIRGFQPR